MLVGQTYLDAINGSQQATSEAALIEPGEAPVVDGPNGAERISGVAVTPNYFRLLGVRPARGRIFEQRDLMQAGRPAMMSGRCCTRLAGRSCASSYRPRSWSCSSAA
jgi:hypothetical protein